MAKPAREADPERVALGQRIKEAARLVGTQAQAADAAGVRLTSLTRWITGENDPNFVSLSRLAKVAGVSLDWLATGQQPDAPPPDPPQAVDARLLARVTEAVATVYREERARLGPADLGRVSADILNDLVASCDHPTEYEAALKVLLVQLRRDLRAAPGPDTEAGKHSA